MLHVLVENVQSCILVRIHLINKILILKFQNEKTQTRNLRLKSTFISFCLIIAHIHGKHFRGKPIQQALNDKQKTQINSK